MMSACICMYGIMWAEAHAADKGIENDKIMEQHLNHPNEMLSHLLFRLNFSPYSKRLVGFPRIKTHKRILFYIYVYGIMEI